MFAVKIAWSIDFNMELFIVFNRFFGKNQIKIN